MKLISTLCSVLLFAGLALILSTSGEAQSDSAKISVLLIDGQNNHAWVETSPVIKKILEDSGRFTVTVSTSPPGLPRAPRAPKDKTPQAKAKFAEAMKAWEAKVAALKTPNEVAWMKWNPNFSSYDVVVSNYNGQLWPENVQRAFEDYVKGGGGFVSVHAANNSFPEWRAYNEMIAVGGWGGRSELSGPYLRLREGEWTKDMTPGKGGAHGQKHEFVVETQVADHPITKGLPSKWMHASDELYDRLRGPAKGVTVIASAFADESTGGSGENEPILMVIDYGKGRVFHTTLGHSTVSMSDVGFAESLKRGTEWVATGSVTFGDVSEADLPADKVAYREGPPAE